MCETPSRLRHGRCQDNPGFRAGDDFPVMVQLSAEEFLMGENPGDKFANDTERPAHRVKFASPFALAKFPVTVGEFSKFNGRSMAEPDGLPVVRVSWHDAVSYCEWLTIETGRHYRLASEAEWEFACRAGSRSPFCTGNEIGTADANFLYDENGARVGVGRRTPVGSFPTNQFGLCDMHGNVCEWIADSWHPDYIGAPADGSAWLAEGDDRKVIRGGAWDYLPRLLRSSWRDWRVAGHLADNIGFRVATSELKDLPAA